MSLGKVKASIQSYIKGLLKTKYPSYFDDNNTVWVNTQDDKEVLENSFDRIECYLAIISNDNVGWGTDGKFYLDEDLSTTTDVWVTEQIETNLITVNIAVTAMKKKNVLTGLQAQNLAQEACGYIRKSLKSLAAMNYFQYDNTFFTPIHVISSEMSQVTDVSDFEETTGRHTFQFTCLFRFDDIGSVITPKAESANVELTGTDIDIEFDIN